MRSIDRHMDSKANEFVVVGLSISERMDNSEEIIDESEMYIGKFNKPVLFYEHFLDAVR